MLNSIKTFQMLTNMRLFHLSHGALKNEDELPYDFKTNHRITTDVTNIFASNTNDMGFIIQAIYPQCYVLIWPNFHSTDAHGPLFSEVFYVVENDLKHQVICCEKCNRIIDTTMFKPASHEYLHICGEQLIQMIQNDHQTVKFNYASRTIKDNHSCDTLCKTVILNEIHMEKSTQTIETLIKEIAQAVVIQSYDKAQNLYYQMLHQMRGTFDDQLPHKALQGQFAYIMTAMTYEIADLLPSLKESLLKSHQIALFQFIKIEHYSNQIVFAQDFLNVYIKLLSSVQKIKTSYKVQLILQIIHKDYAQDITLQAISNQLKIQPTSLSRQFKKEVGVTFSQYLMQYRLNRATLLMDETDYTLTDIAIAVGFDSSTYFSTCFKKMYALTPTAYKKKCIK